MKWLGTILLNSVLFLFLSWLMPSFHVEDFGAALIASFVLALVNILVRPILYILTLPATILTLGLFSFILNALMLLLVNKMTGTGFEITGFGQALLIAILMAILNVILNKTILKPIKS